MKLVSSLFSKKTIKVLIPSFLMLVTISIYGTGSAIAAPPVFWNIFRAEVSNNKVVLKWVVTEYNNRAFYIEHSQNGNSWETIDSVTSKNGALTLDEYIYTHTSKLEGRQYYRVKQVDIDQKNTGYSEVITVVLRKQKENSNRPAISLWPNPATDQVKIVSENDGDVFYTKAVIYDLSGKMVAEKRSDSHTNTINIKELTAGIYLVRVENNDGASFTQKIIKQ